MDEKKSASKIFIGHLSTTFIASVLAITFTGMWLVDTTREHGGLFRLSEGLAFEGILQIFVWSCIISGLVTALTSDIWFSKIMLLWRVVALMILAVAVSVGFAIMFRWLPLDASWEAWATFLVFFIAGFGGGLVAMIAKTKIEDRRFNKLLSEYKAKKEG